MRWKCRESSPLHLLVGSLSPTRQFDLLALVSLFGLAQKINMALKNCNEKSCYNTPGPLIWKLSTASIIHCVINSRALIRHECSPLESRCSDKDGILIMSPAVPQTTPLAEPLISSRPCTPTSHLPTNSSFLNLPDSSEAQEGSSKARPANTYGIKRNIDILAESHYSDY